MKKLLKNWVDILAACLITVLVIGIAFAAYDARNRKSKASESDYAPVGPCQLRTDVDIIPLTEIVAIGIGTQPKDYKRGWLTIFMDDGGRHLVSTDNMTVTELIEATRECRGGKPFYFNVI